MKKYFLVLSFFSFINYGQNKVALLINKVAPDIIPENFKFYYLVDESLDDEMVLDSLNFNSIILLKIRLTEIPSELLSKQKNKFIDWKSYQIDKVKYINQNIEKQRIRNVPDVYFVDEKISNDSLINLKKEKTINTLIIKKSDKWLKSELREQVQKAWEEDKETEKEKIICYSFSTPIFSNDGIYARISVRESKACKTETATYIYKFENKNWSLVAEFQHYSTVLHFSHGDCENFNSFLVIDKL